MQLWKKLKRRSFSMLLLPLSLLLTGCVSSSSTQNKELDPSTPKGSAILPTPLKLEPNERDPSFAMRQKQAEKNFFNVIPNINQKKSRSKRAAEDFDEENELYKASPDQYAMDSEMAAAKGKFGGINIIWPTNGQLSSIFGMRVLRSVKRMHTGIDISAPVGTRILASADGEILFSGPKHGYGYSVIIGHNDDYETMYAHMSIIFVRVGETVRRGQVIGYVGKTGRITGANLHYETRVRGVAHNPLAYLPPSENGRVMQKGMHTPAYAYQMAYYYKINNYAYHSRRSRTP